MPLPVDHVGGRHVENAVAFRCAAFGIEQHSEVTAAILIEKSPYLIRCFLYVDRKNRRTIRRLLRLKRLKSGQFFAAWDTPRRPEIEENDSPGVVAQADGFTVERGQS